MVSSKFSISAVIAVVVLIAVASDLVNASSLTVWSGPGCNNRAERYSKCGCSGIKQHGGYEFTYNGQTAALYNQGGCSGVAHTRFGSSARSCNGFGWKSIFIQC